MSRLIIEFVSLLICFVHLKCDVFHDRPKIKTSNGDLILEPAFDKNIYLLPNGPKSAIYIGETNVLKIESTKRNEQFLPSTTNNFADNLNGPDGIIQRIRRLENVNLFLREDIMLNTSRLWRKVNNLNRKVLALQLQLQNRDRDTCQSQPCEHGGTCLNLLNDYHCLCPSNWEGNDCDIDVNECRNFAGTDLGCQNGALCINRPGSYECLCKPGWFGLHCTRKAKDCSGGDFEMCGYGTCIQSNSGDGIKCICNQGWTTNGTSATCLTDVNECEANQVPHCSVNPRVECINLPGSFRCGRCPLGYEGDGYSCTDIDECVTIPNGGCSPLVACHNTIGSRICGLCPPGYQGDGVTCTWRGSCNINNGGCHPSATCVDAARIGGSGTQCICPDGMEGDGVGLQGCIVATGFNFSQGCENNPCGSHGHCHTLRTGYTCICFKGFTGAHCDISRNFCSVNPCLNGGICRRDDTSLKGYKCECTAQYTGPLCQIMSRTCGGVLDNEEGSIIYPMSNTTYSHKSRCAWVIHTASDKVINITFSKFDLEAQSECLFDFLQIHDGRSSASQLIGRFCGNNFPKGGNIISTHNNLYFWFQSDGSVAKKGFALHWTSIQPVCGGELNAFTHGHISSPGSPGKYPPNRDCYWHLTTTYGKRIQLHFFALDLEKHPNCSFDYLAIYDGERTTDPILRKYCNSTQPAPVQSAGSEILIHFHSDAYGSGNGFQISYAPMEGIPGCGGFFTADKGELISPSFNGSYLSDLLCEYKIKTSVDTKIQIEFQLFNLENSLRCRSDYLKIYDGPSSDSRLVGKFCGTSFPKSYISTTNSLFLIFKTDLSVSNEGFKISYKALCHLNIFGDTGEVKSPGYPFSYPEDKVCEYVISTTPGKVIQLVFHDFDIESIGTNDCPYDYVEVRDGPDVNSTLLGKYCGGSEHTPPEQISSHNFMYIKFNSDLSMTGTGFYANYTTTSSECGGIYRETTGLINHPSGDKATYDNGQSCSWILIAPEGFHIVLTWNRFNLENMPNCDGDYVRLIEIDNENNDTTIGSFCGTNTPPALTTSTNRLKILFESDNSIRSPGFSVSYAFLDGKNYCGGTYMKTHGFIYSPGWPKAYEPNRDCTWVIMVPVGQQIKLNISHFDLERPIRDKCHLGDYLEIRNGGSRNTPLIGQFCGKFQSRLIKSTANVLYLYFHSDFYLTGNGFKIEWDGTVTGCGGTLTSSVGSISSPNYPNNYNENAECFYKIIVNTGSRIHISFTELDLERTPNCNDDYIEIFDGRNSNAASLGRHCFISSALSNIETTSNYAFIKFRSDFYLGGKGFLLNYNLVCQNNLTGRYGVIESPDYPNSYPLHLTCLWNIIVPKGNKINVTFTHFDIYKSFRYNRNWWNNHRTRLGCDRDYLQIKDATDDSFVSKYCGNTLPPAFTSKSNSLQINLVTGYLPRTGFRLEWVIHGCGGHLQKEYGTLLLNKDSTSSSELECEWLIETAIGKSVLLSFTDLYLSENVNCTIDAIEIYNGPDTTYPLLSKICHRDRTTVQSSGNYMLVKLVKHSSLNAVYFQSTFNSQRSLCGGLIEAKSGYIYSKNYPKNYDDNLDCIWTITVPNNHRIEINFIDMDLYSTSSYDDDDENLCADHIQLFDDMSSNYTHLICPNSNVTQIITKSNRVQVRFITNNYGSAKGFKANFTAICGALLTALHDGIISSDLNNPTNSCIWTLVAPKLDQKISLTITYISLPKSNDIITNKSCSLSYLRVYDGDDNNAPLIDEYCGSKVPPMIVSHGSAITIELGNNRDKTVGRFSAHYSPWNNACGGTLSSEEGTIASPNYPRPYSGDVDCEWVLNTSPGNQVYIMFERFNLEFSDRCNEDYLEVRKDSGGGELLGVYCGTDIPVNITTASRLYIKFHSNKENNGEGFLIHYGYLHGNDIVGDNGILASPLYPFAYHGSGEFFWRIITTGTQTIILTIDRLEIQSYGSVCYNKLSIYDGYDDTAPLLEELCGILNPETKIVQTTSSAVYLTLSLDESNTGSLFHIEWTNSDRISTDSYSGDKINCGYNKTELVTISKVFHSPNYPNSYENDLNCQWIFKCAMGNHLNLQFSNFEIEETNGCFADSVSLYSSHILGQWKPIQEQFCVSETSKSFTNISNYLKVTFKTDASMVKKGFEARVSAVCGGLITNFSGTIEPSWQNYYNSISRYNRARCDWTVKVRPGRVIKLQFEHFNITNTNTKCLTSVILHNGDSVNAPLLASGKYCGAEHEIKTDIITSGNAMFVSYINENINFIANFQNFRIRYEEKRVECGVTANLDPDHPWEIINSPNYPSVPTPYSECIWTFRGPPGEILRIDFMDRFDLDDVDGCDTEVVEIRDGSSEMAPRLGRFCSENPGTIKTSDNVLFIKYSTQLAEPRNGFKANISIDICGGTIVSRTGEILSPGYPHLQALPYGTVCEWKIIGPPRNSLLLKSQEIDLPDSESPCATKIVIQEHIPANNTIAILKTFCNDDIETDSSLIETSTNEAMIMFYIGKPSEWTQLSDHRGFRFTFNSSRPVCGGFITTPEGFLMTPSYPLETTLRYCQWLIKVPNKNRRVRIEILDADVLKHKIGIFNDINFQSPIKRIPDDNDNPTNLVIESSTNKLAIYLWLNPLASRHRFKAKFSSEDPILCGGELSGVSGMLISPELQRSYTCEWHYNNKNSLVQETFEYNTIFITASLNSSVSSTRCRYYDPKLNIKSVVNKMGMIFSRDLCGNTEVSYRIPSSVVDFKATKSKSSSLFFHLEWRSQPCGGILHAGETPKNVLTVPASYNGTLECAWIVLVPINNRVQLNMEGTFKLDCDDEYIKISQGLTSNSPTLGEFCKTKLLDSPILTNFKFIYIQYHSKVKNNTDIKVNVKTVSDQCGGYLLSYQNVFETPNYPKNYYPNQECSWELNAELGNRISLNFIERFVIEDQINCTKDVVIIYDWNNDEYTEMARLCGRNLPHSYNSTHNKMKVVLRTDAETNLDGFKAEWIPICGGHYIATEKEQFLYSPRFPYDYPAHLSCSYEISAAGKKAVIKFLEFELEGTYPDCKYDNLTITSDSIVEYYNQVYCGNELPSTLSSDTISLVFYTDSFKQGKGFKMSYKIYSCGGYINTSTVIVSNDFETYHEDMNCTWNIVAPPNKIVVLKLLYIDIEETNDCSNDYISVFDGQIINSNKRLALMCGFKNSTTVLRSRGNTMILQFVTDASVQFKGFKAIVFFSYSTSVGCGGTIEMKAGSSHILKSPLINGNVVYENYLDCLWTVMSPDDTFIKIEFTSFHVAPCRNVNQTALGYNKCDCDYVEVTDGINPNSLVIGKYCGHTQPPQLISSGQMMGIRLLTDGEITSSGFEARLTVQRSVCGQTQYILNRKAQYLKSPGYDAGSIPRGIHCAYHLDSGDNFYTDVHLTITVDLQSPSVKNDGSSICSKDKLVITNIPNKTNLTIGKDFIMHYEMNEFFSKAEFYELTFPKQFELCGHKDSVDLFLYGNIYVNLMTSSDSDNINHKGVQIEMLVGGYCSRNYTAPYGRVQSMYESEDVDRDCYTLITAPENYTISLYFMTVKPNYWNNDCYLDIYDGNDTSSTKIIRIHTEYTYNYPVFSTGRYILLHNHFPENIESVYDRLTFDLNYVTSNKGKGCGGKLTNEIGRVTSPFYPNVYRQVSTCEWELETPFGTQLLLRFSTFDMGVNCDQNYIQLVDRAGNVKVSFCSETPADFTSDDNYVKIMYITTLNNGGTGWVADFVGIASRS